MVLIVKECTHSCRCQPLLSLDHFLCLSCRFVVHQCFTFYAAAAFCVVLPTDVLVTFLWALGDPCCLLPEKAVIPANSKTDTEC